VSAETPPPATRALPRLRVGQWLGLTIGVLLAFAVTGIGLALIANHQLSDQRRVVLDEVEPSLLAALKLENALINQETGVRGYILSGNTKSLEPYEKGLADERQAYRQLDVKRRTLGGPTLAADMRAVQARVTAWQDQFVAPILRRTRHGHTGSIPPTLAGKGLFDAIRSATGRVQDDLAARLEQARRQLSSDASFLEIVLLVAAGLILSSVLGAGLLLRRIITRPLAGLGHQAERVAGRAGRRR
jgi:CHASE3 domain sensor protein